MDVEASGVNERVGKIKAKRLRAEETESGRGKGAYREKAVSLTAQVETVNRLNYVKIRLKTVRTAQEEDRIRLPNPRAGTVLCSPRSYSFRSAGVN